MSREVEGPPPDLRLAACGFVISFIASWCGIGGGLFAVPLLHFGWRLELKSAVATGLVLVLATTSAATATEALQPDPSFTWTVIGPLMLGVWIGSRLGFQFAERIPMRALRTLFVVVLLVAGVQTLIESTVPLGANATGDVGGGRALALAALIGVGGGFLAPLLGVGGGLLMVPALFLIHGLGFEGARASSLAAGVVASLRSVGLHARAGRLRLEHGVRLGLGGLAGAGVGVMVLERWQLFDWGRRALGGILLLVGLRFAWEAARAWREEDQPAP